MSKVKIFYPDGSYFLGKMKVNPIEEKDNVDFGFVNWTNGKAIIVAKWKDTDYWFGWR